MTSRWRKKLCWAKFQAEPVPTGHKSTLFMDPMKQPVSTNVAFKLKYMVKVGEAEKRIVDNTMLSNHPMTKRRERYKMYVQSVKLLMKDNELLHLLETSGRGSDAETSPGLLVCTVPYYMLLNTILRCYLGAEDCNFYYTNLKKMFGSGLPRSTLLGGQRCWNSTSCTGSTLWARITTF